MKIDRLEELNNELSGLLNQQVDDYQKTRLEHIKKIKSQIDMLKNAPPSTDRSDKAHEAISKVVQIIAVLILFLNVSFGQAIFNGKKIHQLPAILSSQYDSTWLTIIGSPSTGTLFKLPLDSLLSGSTGSGGGATLDPVGAHTLYGNETGVSAYPHEISAAQTRTILGLSTVATSGSYADLSNKPFIPEQPNFTAGSNVVFTGTYPNISISSSGGGSATWGFITGGNPLAQTDLAALFNSKEDAISTGTTSQYRRGDKTWQTLNKTAVGLANVDNVSDILKPLSNDAIFALSQKQDQLVSGTNIKKINNFDLVGSGNLTIGSGGTVTSFAKNTSKDSMIIVLGDGTRFAAKDSGTAQTLDQTLRYGNTTDTNFIQFNINGISREIRPANYNTSYGSAGYAKGFTEGVQEFTGVNTPDSRPNVVYSFGYNIGPSGGRINTNEASFRFGYETNYNINSDTARRGFEFHLPEITTKQGNVLRLWSMYVNKSNGFTELNSQIENMYYMRASNGSSWLTLTNSDANNAINLIANDSATTSIISMTNPDTQGGRVSLAYRPTGSDTYEFTIAADSPIGKLFTTNMSARFDNSVLSTSFMNIANTATPSQPTLRLDHADSGTELIQDWSYNSSLVLEVKKDYSLLTYKPIILYYGGTFYRDLTLNYSFGGILKIIGLEVYADDAAAAIGGVATNTVYKTSAGVLMIKN